MQLIATSTMGLEFLVARELKDLGYEAHNSDIEVGRTFFQGDLIDMIRANLHLRTAGKILIELARFAVSNDFDVIFDAAGEIEWEEWMPVDAAILVEARSVRSTITSVPALQRTVKKAIVNRLCRVYGVNRLPEDGPNFTVEISLVKDHAVITLDTTGRGLHRRGYRLMNVAAPLRETLASALVQLSVWRSDRPLIDPFCASGTIPIEAAMLARRIAPGLKREFAAQAWPGISPDLWREARKEAQAEILPPLEQKILGSDIDESALDLARYHAKLAGVGDDIIFRTADFHDLRDDRPYGCVICNPPYGDRIGDPDQLRALYESIPAVLSNLPTWSHYIFTAWNDFESIIGQKATRRRKLYNGRLECTCFQFLGPKPSKKDADFESIRRGGSAISSDKSLADAITLENNRRNDISSCNNVRAVVRSDNSSDNSSDNKVKPEVGSDKMSLGANAGESIGKVVKSAEDILSVNDSEAVRNESSQSGLEHNLELEKSGSPLVFGDQIHESGFPRTNRAPVFAGLDQYAEYQVEEFGKCLTNRIRHLRRFPKRGITSYRLYDRDFPEVPLAIDLYEGEYLHIAEYERPDERSVGQHRLWLDRLTVKAGEILNIHPQNIFLKRRSRQRGESQYEKLSESGRVIEAHEGGLTFLCNMTDYLDTGLFLDHRPTRERVRKEASGKRFLNLFCYTGSFTCYAADGGAALTVSVDLSPNYLDWARANMDANGFLRRTEDPVHRFIKSDVMKFLRNIPPARDGFPIEKATDRSWLDRSQFDLCVCDPPTFSNSKSTEEDWDVQKNHVELLRLLAGRMNVGGVVYFSNNFRRFKLSEDELSDLFLIREISSQTVAEEFRNKKIHQCWRLIVR